MVTRWLPLAAMFIIAGLAVLAAYALSRSVDLRCRGEESGVPADDLMAVADAVSGDYYADTDAREPICLEGFTPAETAVLRANYLRMTDDERFRLDMAWRSIVEGADR